mmetsp:Transcript_16795/g.45763  ORF Transcript_16795/g.45763 Transcript_16795/m.45763 type:complete len:205 (-) Transcript_16795:582-1196(-)
MKAQNLDLHDARLLRHDHLHLQVGVPNVLVVDDLDRSQSGRHAEAHIHGRLVDEGGEEAALAAVARVKLVVELHYAVCPQRDPLPDHNLDPRQPHRLPELLVADVGHAHRRLVRAVRVVAEVLGQGGEEAGGDVRADHVRHVLDVRHRRLPAVSGLGLDDEAVLDEGHVQQLRVHHGRVRGVDEAVYLLEQAVGQRVEELHALL